MYCADYRKGMWEKYKLSGSFAMVAKGGEGGVSWCPSEETREWCIPNTTSKAKQIDFR